MSKKIKKPSPRTLFPIILGVTTAFLFVLIIAGIILISSLVKMTSEDNSLVVKIPQLVSQDLTEELKASLLEQNIVVEIEAAVADGYKEFTLLGQNVNSYGKDFGEKDAFAKLLRRVNEIPGVDRIHYMTSHPRDMSEEVIKAVAECEHICENFHVPFQSGSTEILRRMNRGYSREKYLELIALIRKYVPNCTITTDIIVGFPGETEEDFEDTLNLVKEVGFDAAFTFIYSKRSGTPAAKMDNQVPLDVKKARLNRLMEAQNINSLKCNEKLIGEVVEVLAEGPSKNKDVWNGRTRTGKLVLWPLEGKTYQAGDKVYVKIDTAQTWLLKGKAVDNG